MPRRILGALDGLVDGVLQAGFGRQRRLGVIFLAGHDVVAGQRAVGDQLAVDIAGEVGLGDAVAVGRHTGRHPLEAEIGGGHAGRPRWPARRQSRARSWRGTGGLED